MGQTLPSMHMKLSSGDLTFGLRLHLHSYFVSGIIQCAGKTVWLCMLILAYTARTHDKYQNITCLNRRPDSCYYYSYNSTCTIDFKTYSWLLENCSSDFPNFLMGPGLTHKKHLNHKNWENFMQPLRTGGPFSMDEKIKQYNTVIFIALIALCKNS